MTEKRLNEDEWDDEYTVKSLKEFLNSPYIDDDFPVRLGISEWNFSKSCNFYARQITSFGKPFVCLESMEINNDYNEIYDKWIDKKIENNKLKKENKELKAKVDDKEVAVEVECEKLMQKVFNLINAKIKLYSHKPVSAPISQPMSVNFDADVDRLARLSELEALKEELTE